MKNIFSNFMYNLKMYLKYIVKVGFKELFFDVMILVLMAVIAAFAYIPVSLVQDLVRSLIISFIPLNGIGASLFTWVFDLVKAACAIVLFIYLFNMRYDFKNEKVVPIKGSYTLERKDSIFAPDEDDKKERPEKAKDFNLPKEKEK